MEGNDGEPVKCFIIDQRDIKYILEDFEEVTYDDDDNQIKIIQPKVNLITPNKKIHF
jgi:hypothetical protein